MSALTDAFELLGLPETAAPDEVRARYKQLAAERHPDVGGDAAKFTELNRAYIRALDHAQSLQRVRQRCPACQGTGKAKKRKGFMVLEVPCEACNGEGVAL